VSPELEGSARDIEAQLRKDKLVRLVNSDDDARVIVLVTSRTIHSQPPSGSMDVPVGNSVMPVPMENWWDELHVVLRVGDHTSEYVSTCRRWTDCAKKVATPIGAWIAANAAALSK
jgi:hypothetical protein